MEGGGFCLGPLPPPPNGTFMMRAAPLGTACGAC
jgi:hypothetical protein